MNEPVHPMAGKTGAARPAGRERGRTNDPERTRADILAVAEQEFGEKGLAGPKNHYYLIGDNLDKSDDSRRFGSVEEKDILYKVIL